MEIFTNPYDLEILFLKEEDKRHRIFIHRGPGHNFKIIANSEISYETRDTAANTVNKILQSVIEEGNRILSDPSNIITSFINPHGLPPEQFENQLLNERLLAEITSDLKATGIASTYNYKKGGDENAI